MGCTSLPHPARPFLRPLPRCCCCQTHPGIPRHVAAASRAQPPPLPPAHPRSCAGSGGCSPRPAAWAQGNRRYRDWKIPGLKSPGVSQAGSPQRWPVELGMKQAVRFPPLPPRPLQPELSGGMFPMTAIPTLLLFSFLLTFPCAESFLKESQEGGNVPAVTLAGIAPGWMSQAAKGCPRKEGPQQPDLLLGLLSLRHLVLCSPLSHRTGFLGAESVVTGMLLPEILHSCHRPAHTISPQQ